MNLEDELNRELKGLYAKYSIAVTSGNRAQAYSIERQMQKVQERLAQVKRIAAVPAPVTMQKYTKEPSQLASSALKAYPNPKMPATKIPRPPAHVAMNSSGMVRCTGEVNREGACGPYFCDHREKWLASRDGFSELARKFNIIVERLVDKRQSYPLKLPISRGLVIAYCVLTLNKVGEDNAERSVQYILEHRLLQGDLAISLELSPWDGDTFRTAAERIEDFYRTQPEYEEINSNNAAIPCVRRDLHTTNREEEFLKVIHTLPGVTADTPRQTLLDLWSVAHSFARINTPGYAGSPGECIMCYYHEHLVNA